MSECSVISYWTKQGTKPFGARPRLAPIYFNPSIKLNHLVSACEYMEYIVAAVPRPLAPQPYPTRSLSRHYSVTVEDQSSSHTPRPFPTRDMTHQPASDRFQALLESALQEYEKQAGVILADRKDSLAIQELQLCHSIDDITTLLQVKTQAFNDVQQRDRTLKSIRATVSILTPISSVTSVADDVGLVGRKVMEACLAFLTCFYRHYSHMRKRYILLSVSY